MEGHRWKGEGGKLSWRLEDERRLYSTRGKVVGQRMAADVEAKRSKPFGPALHEAELPKRRLVH